MPLIPIARFVVDAVASETVDDGIRVFPQPLPCRLCEDSLYRPLVMSVSGKFLGKVVSNRCSLAKLKVRSVTQPEELPQAKLEKVVFGADPSSWVTILRTRTNHQEIWTKNVPQALLGQLRLAYEENMEIVDLAIGNGDAWYLQAANEISSNGRHIFFGGEISSASEFRRILSAASTVHKVQFVGKSNGWLVSYDDAAFAWTNLSEKLSECLEEVLSSTSSTLTQVVCGAEEDAWFVSVLENGRKSARFGRVSEQFVRDTQKLHTSEIFLGPSQAHFMREHDRTFSANILDQDLANFLR